MNDNHDVPAPLLASLRAATADSHGRLDAAFGSLALAERPDYIRFLAGHFIGLSPVAAAIGDFAHRELDCEAPDLVAMLRGDLAELGLEADDLPRLDPPDHLEPLAATYVVAGSRLGLAMIRRQEYWGRSHGLASRYMEDERGLALWRAFAAAMRGRDAPPDETARACASAVSVFDLFGRAFALSASAMV